MSKLKTYKFSDLYDMSSGISSKPEQAGHGSPFVSFKTVFNNYFIPEKLNEFMSVSDHEQESYSVKKGDIFLTRTSESLDELAMSCVAVKDYPNATYSGFLKRLRPTQGNITYDKYIAFYLRSQLFRKTMTNNAIMTLRASFNEQIFSYLDLILPEYEVQKKSGDFLYTINEKINVNNKINAELEAMAKTLYDYWFVQFDFPFDFAQGKPDANGKPYKSSGGRMVYNEELKREIPEGWEVKKTEELVNDIRTGLNPRDHFKLGEGSNYYITIKNIEYGRIQFDDSCDRISDEAMVRIQKRSNLEKGDILFTSIEPVGKTYLLSENPSNWNINESVFSFKPNLEEVSPEYLFMLLSSSSFNGLCKNASTGSIHKGIRITPMKAFKVVHPEMGIINEFTKIVSQYLSLIDNKQKENQELCSLRDWLLPMLMNGQVTVAEVEEQLGMVAEAGEQYK